MEFEIYETFNKTNKYSDNTRSRVFAINNQIGRLTGLDWFLDRGSVHFDPGLEGDLERAVWYGLIGKLDVRSYSSRLRRREVNTVRSITVVGYSNGHRDTFVVLQNHLRLSC